MKIAIKTFIYGVNGTNCYIVYDKESGEAFCVDVGDELGDEYIDFMHRNALQPRYLFLTHGHYDHTLALKKFAAAFEETKIVISKADDENIRNGLRVFCDKAAYVTPDILVEDGDTFSVLGATVRVISTPGHTSGSVCYQFENHLFCGDTVFRESIGRTDMPTGSFFEIIQSVKKIAALGNLKLYPGHMGVTDMAHELKYNEYFKL